MLHRPIQSLHGRDNLSKIAVEAGLTKQCISKWMTQFRDELNMSRTCGKSDRARETYRVAQNAAVAAGTHASFKRRDRRVNAGSEQ